MRWQQAHACLPRACLLSCGVTRIKQQREWCDALFPRRRGNSPSSNFDILPVCLRPSIHPSIRPFIIKLLINSLPRWCDLVYWSFSVRRFLLLLYYFTCCMLCIPYRTVRARSRAREHHSTKFFYVDDRRKRQVWEGDDWKVVEPWAQPTDTCWFDRLRWTDLTVCAECCVHPIGKKSGMQQAHKGMEFLFFF